MSKSANRLMQSNFDKILSWPPIFQHQELCKMNSGVEFGMLHDILTKKFCTLTTMLRLTIS